MLHSSHIFSLELATSHIIHAANHGKIGLQSITFENYAEHLPRVKVHTLDFLNSK